MGYSTCGAREHGEHGASHTRRFQTCEVCDACPECEGRSRLKLECRICCGPLVACSEEHATQLREHIRQAKARAEARTAGQGTGAVVRRGRL